MVYVKPSMQRMTMKELQELITAYASCPNCYQGCNYQCW